MDRVGIVDLIKRAVEDVITSDLDDKIPELTEDTRLAGNGAIIDSIGLVTVILEIEASINETIGTIIVIADDRAMSQTRSPFRTIGTLADYVLILINETN